MLPLWWSQTSILIGSCQSTLYTPPRRTLYRPTIKIQQVNQNTLTISHRPASCARGQRRLAPNRLRVCPKFTCRNTKSIRSQFSTAFARKTAPVSGIARRSRSKDRPADGEHRGWRRRGTKSVCRPQLWGRAIKLKEGVGVGVPGSPGSNARGTLRLSELLTSSLGHPTLLTLPTRGQETDLNVGQAEQTKTAKSALLPR